MIQNIRDLSPQVVCPRHRPHPHTMQTTSSVEATCSSHLHGGTRLVIQDGMLCQQLLPYAVELDSSTGKLLQFGQQHCIPSNYTPNSHRYTTCTAPQPARVLQASDYCFHSNKRQGMQYIPVDSARLQPEKVDNQPRHPKYGQPDPPWRL